MTLPGQEPIAPAAVPATPPPGFAGLTFVTTPDEDDGDELAYLPNGMIRAKIDDAVHMLRVPKLGQYRVWRAALADISTAAQEHRIARLAALDADPPVVLDIIDQSPQMVGWLREVFDKLDMSGHKLPDDDDLPSYFTDAQLPGEMMVHWRQRPTPRGGSPK